VKRGKTGRHELQSKGEEAVRAFVPSPLPPDPPLVLDGTLQTRLEAAGHAVGRLDVISTLLPDPTLFLYGKRPMPDELLVMDRAGLLAS